MLNCLPNADFTACVNCGWRWTRPDICEWPRRNCPASPDIAPAADALGISTDEYRQLQHHGDPAELLPKVKAGAEKLGYTLADVRHWMAAIVRWTKAGCPVRDQAEVERIERELCRPCEYYVNGRCRKCGCNVTASSIPITNKIKMATERCPEGKWPTDQGKASSNLPDQQLPISS